MKPKLAKVLVAVAVTVATIVLNTLNEANNEKD